MKKSSTNLGVIILTVLAAQSAAFAQEVSLHIDFTGSSFDTKSNQLQGAAKQSGKKFVADRLVLPLASLHSGVALRDKHTLKYFGADKFPEAVLTNVVGENGKFRGDLTVHGVTKKGVEGEYTQEGNRLRANFKTNISDYKIEPPTYMGGSISVEDEVEIKALIPFGAGTAAPVAAVPAGAMKKVVAPARAQQKVPLRKR